MRSNTLTRVSNNPGAVHRNQKSRISLVAHKREVSGSVLQNYIPEFEDQFYEKDRGMEDGPERNYIIKA